MQITQIQQIIPFSRTGYIRAIRAIRVRINTFLCFLHSVR